MTVAPYMGVLLSDYVGVGFDLSATAAIGYGSLDHDQSRLDAVGGRITSETDSDRYFFIGTLLAGWSFGDWYVGAQTGLLFAREEVDGFAESNGRVVPAAEVSLGQVNIGGDVAYSWDSFEPFASAIFTHDFNQEELGGGHPNDANELQLGIGVRYYSDTGMTGSVEYRKSLLREDFDSDTLTFTIRADF